MAFRQGEEHVFLGKEIQEPRDFSEGTAQVIDEEVQRLLREADERAFEVIQGHRDELEKLVAALLQKEELLKDEIEALLGVCKPPADLDGKAPLTVVPVDENGVRQPTAAAKPV
jgi:cell division protease FtsH